MSPRKSAVARKLGVDPEVSDFGGGPDPIVVRGSEIADFRDCPLKHKLGWLDGWHSPAREAGGARELGTVWHNVLKIRYRYLQMCQEIGDEPVESEIEVQVRQAMHEAHSELRETLFWMYDGYREMYGWDRGWKILSVEQTLQVPFHDKDDKPLRIIDPRTGKSRPVLYSWTTDILAFVPMYRALMVIDTKSTSQPLGQVDIDLSDQFGLYTVAWLRLGKKIRGQLVNQAKTKALKRPMTLDERFVRTPSIRTPIELRNLELDAVRTVKAMYSEANLLDGPYSSPDPRSCGWKCDFKEPHLKLRRTRPGIPVANVMKAFGLEQGATHGQ